MKNSSSPMVLFPLPKTGKVKQQLTALALLAASSISAQQNGLNNAGGFTELGGNLIHGTDVTLDNSGSAYNLVFNGDGRFGVGNLLTPSSINGYSSKTTFRYSNPGTSGLGSTIGAYYDVPTNVTIGSATGIENYVTASCTGNMLGYNSRVWGNSPGLFGMNIEATSLTGGGSNTSIGIQVSSRGALNAAGGVFYGRTAPGLGAFANAKGIYAEGGGDSENFGGFFRADSGWSNRGVYSETRNGSAIAGSLNYAVYGLADGGGSSALNVGVQGVADNASTSFAVAGYLGNNNYANPHTPGINAAIYGDASTATGSSPYAGYFIGDVYVNGSGTYTGIWTSSDRRLKKEITPIANSADIISKLHPKSFIYNKENEFGLRVSDKKDYGIIAQELEEVLPELVKEVATPAEKDKDGNTVREAKTYKTVNYIGFIGILLANAQEQQQQLDEQQQLNETLQQQVKDQQLQISELQKKSGTTGIDPLNNSGIAGFSMNQNEPNPFTHETVIAYNLPLQINNAYMAVYDLTGKQVTTLPITQKGAASIKVTSEKLAAGIYIYSIVADGKVMDSKRMIVADK